MTKYKLILQGTSSVITEVFSCAERLQETLDKLTPDHLRPASLQTITTFQATETGSWSVLDERKYPK